MWTLFSRLKVHIHRIYVLFILEGHCIVDKLLPCNLLGDIHCISEGLEVNNKIIKYVRVYNFWSKFYYKGEILFFQVLGCL